MTASDIFYSALLSFIGGIFLSSFLNVPLFIIYELVFLGVFYSLLFFRLKPVLRFGVCLAIFALGAFYYQEVNFRFEKSPLRNYISKEIEAFGEVSKEPDIRENFQKVKIRVDRVVYEGKTQNLSANILANTNSLYSYHCGDRVKVRGILKKPKIFSDFNYRDYLKKDNIFAIMAKAKIEILSKNRGKFFQRHILSLKRKLEEVVYENFPLPQSSILGAILLGDKSKISAEWKKKLNVAGVRHITAISGMHIVILSGILMEFLVIIGFWRQQAFCFTLAFLWFYIVLVGCAPSAVRAGIMMSFFLFCQRIGRAQSAGRVLVLALFLMLLLNPFLLRYDVGFQLSFLATLGIIYLYPFFQKHFNKIHVLRELKVSSILAITFSAECFTLPILIYNFGYFSLISPLSNILITPLLPFVIASGILFLISGVIWQPLAFLSSLPVYFLLKLITFLVNFFSKFPLASLSLKISWIYLPIFYSLLAIFVYWLSLKEKEVIIKVK
ncbi:ComEC family competence protein [bacterium]|nr:ComEC family competence protein [bacterium]